MPKCFLCFEQFMAISHLMIHLNIFHNVNNIIEFKCLELNCFRSFSNLNSFKKHLNDHPINLICNNSDKAVNTYCELIPPDVSNIPSNSNILINVNQNIESIDDIKKQIYQNSIALISKWYSYSGLPRKTVQQLIDDLLEFNSMFLSILKEKISRVISLCNDDNIGNELSQIKDIILNFGSPFESMQTEYLRLQTLDEQGLLVRPEEVSIGYRLNDRLCNGRVVLEPRADKISVIPLRLVFKKLLEHSNMFEIILNYISYLKTTESELISSFIQSQLWKEKLRINQNKIILPLFLYFDDFEVNNPLGSHAGSQKLGAVYVSLSCLPPELSSSLNNIFLASLFKSDDKKYYGNRIIFYNLITELNYLEETGITITIKNVSHQIYFSLGLILGDNLGLHSILGFSENFIARYPCRFCKCSKTECHSQLKQNDNCLRNLNNYNADVITNDSSLTGIKEMCTWNDVHSFSVVNNFSVDIMHDLLEGVFKYDLALILNHLIYYSKYISLENLNNRIETFNYGPVDIRNRPTLITEDNLKRQKTIKMTASEMLCFSKYLGLIIGDLIPSSSQAWSLYLLLKQILDITLSKSVRPGDAILLKTLISDHHELYLKLFNVHLKPKHHHMVHYPFIIEKSGPLSLFWSMRFEAKHKELKDTANSITSRKNIVYTLSLKQQLQLAFILSSPKSDVYTIPIKIGKIIKLPQHKLKMYNTKTQFVSIPFNCISDKSMFVTWVNIKGTMYNTKNMSIIINVSDEDNLLPTFGLIKSIFITDNNKPYAIVKLFITNYFDEHYQAFNVSFNHVTDFSCVSLEDIGNINPTHHVVLSNDMVFISVKY